MKLYFLRHAIAVDLGTKGYFKDPLRPLTDEGMAKFKTCCKGLIHLNLQWDLILTSPYVRARQTAEILADTFDCSDLIKEAKFLAPGHTTIELNKGLSEFTQCQSIILVGHEPSLSEHISQYISHQSNTQITLKKGGLALVEFEELPQIGKGSLNYLLTPAIMKRL